MGKFSSKLFVVIVILSFVSTIFGNTPSFAFSKRNPLVETSNAFSQKADLGFLKVGKAIDKSLLALAKQLDEKPGISLMLNSHFYDKRIRRFFFSLSGRIKYLGLLPYKIISDHYYISKDGIVSYDIEVNNIKKIKHGITFNFSGVVVISLQDLVYRLITEVPNLVAAQALSSTTDLLANFFSELKTGLLAEATSKTIVKFSRVSIIKLGADLVVTASNNKNVKKFIASSVKDGTLLSFLGLTLLKAGLSSGIKLCGASLGASVGSVVAPGSGTVLGAFIGSRITSMIACAIVYKTMAKIPIYHSLKRIVRYQQLLNKNPADREAREKIERNTASIIKKIKLEFVHNKFKSFDMVIKKIDSYEALDRVSFVPLLKGLKDILSFKILNEGDWYYAKRYYRLKQFVEKWKLDKQVKFTTK